MSSREPDYGYDLAGDGERRAPQLPRVDIKQAMALWSAIRTAAVAYNIMQEALEDGDPDEQAVATHNYDAAHNTLYESFVRLLGVNPHTGATDLRDNHALRNEDDGITLDTSTTGCYRGTCWDGEDGTKFDPCGYR